MDRTEVKRESREKLQELIEELAKLSVQVASVDVAAKNLLRVLNSEVEL